MRELETEKQNRGVNWPRRGCCANCVGHADHVHSSVANGAGRCIFKIGRNLAKFAVI